ncbi:hypothetical protein ACIQUM_36915 [Amycolatopsis azurea]
MTTTVGRLDRAHPLARPLDDFLAELAYTNAFPHSPRLPRRPHAVRRPS